MSATVTQLPGEPIVIVTMIDASPDVFPSYNWSAGNQVARLLQSTEGPIYRITDLSALNGSAKRVASALQQEAKRPGSAADPRIHEVLIGTPEMVRSEARAVSQPAVSSSDVPLFVSLMDALLYVRGELARQTHLE